MDGIDLNAVSIERLSTESRNLLSSLLNTRKVIKSVCLDNIARYRDWRGLASLIRISTQVEAGIKECPDKVARVLELWLQNDQYATIGRLLDFLQQLDRYDVFDDLVELAKLDKLIAPETSQQVAQHVAQQLAQQVADDANHITYDDERLGSPQRYHAYVLYAKEDRGFGDHLIKRLTAEGFKLCTEDNLLPGFATRFEPLSRLISERCRRIIIIYSPDLFRSSAAKFLTHFAQAHGVESNLRNLIPIMYRYCVLPKLFAHYHNLTYQEHDATFDFWKKLSETLAAGTGHPRLRNGTVSSEGSGIRIQEIPPSITNGYTPPRIVHPPQDNTRLALPAAPRSVTPDPRNYPISTSSSLHSLPTLYTQCSLSEPARHEAADSRSMTNVEEGKSKKKNPMEKFFSQVKSFGKKKKVVMVKN